MPLSRVSRRVDLAKKTALLGAVVMAAWTLFDAISANVEPLAIEATLTFVMAGVWWTAHKGFRSAPLLAVIAANLTVLSGALIFDRNTGSTLPFFALSTLPWVFFEKSSKAPFVFSALLPIILYGVVESPLKETIYPFPPMQASFWYFAANALATFLVIACVFKFHTKGLQDADQRDLRHIVDASLIGVMIGKSSNGEVIQANDLALDLFGYTRAEFDRGEFDIFRHSPPEYRERTQEMFDEVKRDGRSRFFEKEYVRKDGTRVPVLVAAAELGDPENEEMIGFILNLEAQKELAGKIAQLEKSQEVIQAWQDFLSIASHELKTPVTALLLQSQLLQRITKEKPDADPRFDKLITQSVSVSARLKELVDQLLDFSQVRIGRISLYRKRIDVETLVKGLVDRLESSGVVQPGLIRLSTQGRHESDLDEVKFERVISNLVSNAVKYGNGQPIIISIGKLESGGVRVTVKDNGPGISAEEQKTLFRKFERGAEAIRGPKDGLGLGLFISQGIVHAHGGKILIQSQPGQGLEAIVEIPTATSQTHS